MDEKTFMLASLNAFTEVLQAHLGFRKSRSPSELFRTRVPFVSAGEGCAGSPFDPNDVCSPANPVDFNSIGFHLSTL